MASIYTPLQGMYFTSAIPDIVVTSTKSSATVSIVDEDHHVIVVQMTVFMYYNRATLRNLRTIIESYLESSNKCFAYLTIHVSDDNGAAEDDLFVIYNKYAIDSTPEDFLAINFLSTARSKIICPNVKEHLSWYVFSKSDYSFTDSDEEPNTIKFTWRFANETIFFAQTLEELRLKTTRTFTSQFDQTFK